ncbi:hypothetical protein TBR22_A24010 [Luteitalea sp. TBR-22]|uniref:YdcF family protein n=1 Tax=Luteitalea sp. TBR-22 TaxID=2802971 RepID=UPI001AF3A1C0|nr:YdcF family protein [Luteitalea sp. TBR-22]BCS33174.1 hypothetical protein TBR22_A24010 [Luteitalea sp. TBR-22]
MNGRHSPRRWTAWLAGVVAVLLVGTLPLGPWLVRSRPVASPEVILVLGSHESERLPHAARLARQWPTARIWLTQPVVVTLHNCEDCAHRIDVLGRLGVDPPRVRLIAPRVRNTFDELAAARRLAAAEGVRRILVVTSPYHTRRVIGLVSAAGWLASVGVEPCPTPSGLAWPWWSRRYDRRYVVYEVAALAENSWRHGIAPRHWLAADRGAAATL